jgi:cysteine desulfuration protein SufE
MTATMPETLQRLVDLFAASPKAVKVQAMVDYSNRLADPPDSLANSGTLQQVHECQTPFFVATELGPRGQVVLSFDVPRESPTMRGFAGILADGLRHASAKEILALSPTFYTAMGLEEVVSPLRLRGMAAIVATIQAQVRRALEAGPTTPS